MSDHFSDRFWSTRFWATRYFQGGEQATGAMRATLSGSSSLSANLTSVNLATPIPVPQAYPFQLIVEDEKPRKAFMRATLSGRSALGAKATGQAQLRATIEGVCSVTARPEGHKDFSGVDNFFWFMAA